MKKFYISLLILIIALIVIILNSICVFSYYRPNINTRVLSYIAPFNNYVCSVLDATLKGLSKNGMHFKYLFLYENGSEFLRGNNIPNDIDYGVGVYLGTYKYDGTNIDDIVNKVLWSAEAYLNALNLNFYSNKEFVGFTPGNMLKTLYQNHDECKKYLSKQLSDRLNGKQRLLITDFMLKNSDNIYKISYPYKFCFDEILLLNSPGVYFFSDKFRFNKTFRKYPREATFHVSYYFDLETKDGVKSFELSPASAYGSSLGIKFNFLANIVFTYKYSATFMDNIYTKFFDDNAPIDNYINLLLATYVTFENEILSKRVNGAFTNPVKVLKRTMQCANLLASVIEPDIYDDIYNIFYKNINDKDIQLLNEYRNILDVMYSIKKSGISRRLWNKRQINKLKVISDTLVNELEKNGNIPASDIVIFREFQNNFFFKYFSVRTNNSDVSLAVKQKYNKVINTIDTIVLERVSDTDKLYDNLLYMSNLLESAGIHKISLYYINDFTVGILKDGITDKIKDTKKFAEENGLADITYILIDKNQIPKETVKYNIYAKCPATPQQEENYKALRKALIQGRKFYTKRYNYNISL